MFSKFASITWRWEDPRFFSSSSRWVSTGYIRSASKTNPVDADVGDTNALGGAAAEVKARIANVATDPAAKIRGSR